MGEAFDPTVHEALMRTEAEPGRGHRGHHRGAGAAARLQGGRAGAAPGARRRRGPALTPPAARGEAPGGRSGLVREGLLRDARCRQGRRRHGDQEGVPQARAHQPPRRQRR
nr:hypothetical protein [Angustibacter aerolatus]